MAAPRAKRQAHSVNHSLNYVNRGIEALRGTGARITKPRLAVLECLAAAEKALAPKDIMDRLERGTSSPKRRAKTEATDGIDLATVYRILEALLALDLVHQVGPSGDFVACGHLECGDEMHIIVRCTQCAAASELELPESLLAPVKRYLERTAHFYPEQHFMQVSGRCAKCAAAAN